ncbi:helix-turn-helix domain-containing protein [Actinocorallia longicatena]|uniref:Uncharacterized protein n=1 Tax=Actinocorallia longicatena TaxID=111803 RepID=A0ABP6QEV4_9ACTN
MTTEDLELQLDDETGPDLGDLVDGIRHSLDIPEGLTAAARRKLIDARLSAIDTLVSSADAYREDPDALRRDVGRLYNETLKSYIRYAEPDLAKQAAKRAAEAIDLDGLVTPDQAAEILGVDLARVWSLIEAKTLRLSYAGVLISRAEVEERAAEFERAIEEAELYAADQPIPFMPVADVVYWYEIKPVGAEGFEYAGIDRARVVDWAASILTAGSEVALWAMEMPPGWNKAQEPDRAGISDYDEVQAVLTDARELAALKKQVDGLRTETDPFETVPDEQLAAHEEAEAGITADLPPVDTAPAVVREDCADCGPNRYCPEHLGDILGEDSVPLSEVLLGKTGPAAAVAARQLHDTSAIGDDDLAERAIRIAEFHAQKPEPGDVFLHEGVAHLVAGDVGDPFLASPDGGVRPADVIASRGPLARAQLVAFDAVVLAAPAADELGGLLTAARAALAVPGKAPGRGRNLTHDQVLRLVATLDQAAALLAAATTNTDTEESSTQ